ncbi:hypothetical protein H0H92_000684 [Tricholoma furcatifolium]|nr:hypothetical protein H0H92_000684 [Tricholoma furcatifolium]
MQHIISCKSRLFDKHCSRHAFLEGEDVQIPDIGYSGSAHWMDYHGSCPALKKKDTEAQVRVKLWFGGLAMSDETREDFYRCIAECLDRWKRVAAHKHIAPFYGLIPGPKGSGLPLLITPLYKANINDHLRCNPEVNPLLLLVKVANAVEYLHSFNPPIVHGGIRGDNILINDCGEPVLTDLGLEPLPQLSGASALDEHFDSVRWSAPELVSPPDDVAEEYDHSTPETDVYSFGMTILEVLTKEKPWATKKRNVTIVIDLSEKRRPPRPRHEAITDSMKLVASTLNVLLLQALHRPVSNPS